MSTDKPDSQLDDPSGDPESEAGQGGPTITASDEMQEALREAERSLDEPADPPPAASSAGENSPDKLTIELLSNELQSLKDAFEARGKELEEANERHLRLQAEFENFRRRTLKERQEAHQYGHQNLVKDLLTTVDNLDRAVEHTEQSADADLRSLLQGVELVRRELLGGLGKHGVTIIEAEGELFDPAYHEAIGQVPTADVEPNTVIQVLQKGYLLRDRMLRPARVMVAAPPADEDESKPGRKS